MTAATLSHTNTRLASKMRQYRTKAGLTQTDTARVAGIKREYLSSIELGRIQVLYPEVFNSLHHALRFPGYELLEDMGYVTDAKEQGVNDGLLTLIRSLTTEQQESVASFIKATLRMTL